MVINLLTNACQALPSHDRGITVSPHSPEDGWVCPVEVEDPGVGIPPQNIPRVTDPFFTTKRASGGSCGTRRLLAHRDQSRRNYELQLAGRQGNPGDCAPAGGRRIAVSLLVSRGARADSPWMTRVRIRSSVRTALLLAGITNLAEREDGDAAAAAVREQSFAGVVLDLMMPGIWGLDLLSLILEERPGDSRHRGDGDGRRGDRREMHARAGAFDYLEKPINRTRLVTSLRHAIEKWETAREVTSLREGMLSSQPAHPEAFKDIVTRDPGDALDLQIRRGNRPHIAARPCYRRSGEGARSWWRGPSTR